MTFSHLKTSFETELPSKSQPKFQLFAQFLSQINQSVHLRIPETLVKPFGETEELYYCAGKSGEVTVERQK